MIQPNCSGRRVVEVAGMLQKVQALEVGAVVLLIRVVLEALEVGVVVLLIRVVLEALEVGAVRNRPLPFPHTTFTSATRKG